MRTLSKRYVYAKYFLIIIDSGIQIIIRTNTIFKRTIRIIFKEKKRYRTIPIARSRILS